MQPDYSFEPFTRHTLKNGLEILLCRDHSVPIVTSMLWYRTGSINEKTGGTGLSHFLEHMLFKGSQSFAKGEIDRLTLECGGSNNAFTWLDATTYLFNLPASHWELALKIEADRMQGALLDPAEIEAERQVILEEWQTAEDDPDERFWEALNSLALQRHPYRNPVLGWPEDIRSLSRAQLLAHYRQYYHPGQAVLILVGDLPAHALETIEAHLGSLPRGPEPPVPLQISESRRPGQKRLWIPSEDIQLPRLLICWPAPALKDPDYFAMVWLQYLLTEGWSSRLHQALVENQHFAGDVSSILFETQDPYLFWIQLELTELVPAAEVEAVLFNEIRRLQSEGVSPEEFARIQNQLLTDHYLNQESTQDRAELAGELILSGGWEVFETYQQSLQAVTAADLQAAACNWLNLEHYTLGWLWPQSPATSDNPGPEAGKILESLKHQRHEAQAFAGQTTPLANLAAVLPATLEMPRLQTHHTNYANGLSSQIHLHRKTPTFSLVCSLAAGSQSDPAGQSGLANLTLSSLIKGTHKRKARDFAEALESLGANLSLATHLNHAMLEVSALSSHLEAVVELLREALLEPAFSSSEVNKEKRLILADLQLAQESSGFQANSAFLGLVYGQSAAAFPVEGQLESVRALSPEAVRDFYQQHYSPARGILTLAGNLEPDDAQECLQQAFGNWHKAGQPRPEIPELKAQEHFVYQHLPLSGRDQCNLLLGHLGVPREHPDFVALLLLDVILGNGPGFASRIPRRLRDQQGLAYYVSLSTTIGSQIWPGLVQAQVETSPERALDCLKIILEEIRRVQQDGIRADELRAAQAYLRGRFVFLFESNSQRSNYLVQQALYGWPQDYLNRYLEQIQQTEAESLQLAAQKHIHTHHYSLITAGARPHWNPEILPQL